MAEVQRRRRSLTALRVCVPASTGVRECVRAGEVDGGNLREREREREGILFSCWSLLSPLHILTPSNSLPPSLICHHTSLLKR